MRTQGLRKNVCFPVIYLIFLTCLMIFGVVCDWQKWWFPPTDSSVTITHWTILNKLCACLRMHHRPSARPLYRFGRVAMTCGRLRPGRFIGQFGRVFSDRAGPGFRPDLGHLVVQRAPPHHQFNTSEAFTRTGPTNYACQCKLPRWSDEADCSNKRVSKLGCVTSSALQNWPKASWPLADRRSTNKSARNRASDDDSISRSSAELNSPFRTSIGSTRDTSSSFTINALCLHKNLRATPRSAIFSPYIPLVLGKVLTTI